MLENITVIILYAIFIRASLYLRKRVVKASAITFAAFIPAYLIGIWLYAELTNQGHYLIRDHTNIFLDFGYASILLVMLWAATFITGIFFILNIAWTRYMQRKK